MSRIRKPLYYLISPLLFDLHATSMAAIQEQLISWLKIYVYA